MVVKNEIAFEDALAHPEKHFYSPEAILLNRQLSKSEKLQILKAWRKLAKSSSVAVNEGMTVKTGPSLFEKIANAINQISD